MLYDPGPSRIQWSGLDFDGCCTFPLTLQPLPELLHHHICACVYARLRLMPMRARSCATQASLDAWPSFHTVPD